MNESKHTQWLRVMERAIAENWPMLPSPPDERDWPLSRIAEPVAIPASVRLDHLVPRILSQGKCGSCVGMAGAQIKNALANRRRALPEGGLSPLFLYARCKQEDGIPTTEGTYPRIALKIMQRDGICPEKDLPYSMLPQNACLSFPRITQAHIDAAAPYKIKAYVRLHGVDDIKQALAAGKLVMAGILVTDNFIRLPANNVVGLPDGQMYGLHAIVICGYDDVKKAFRMVNSWGTIWGEKGFAWLTYEFCQWESLDLKGLFALEEAWAVESEYVPEQKIEMWIGTPAVIVNGQTIILDVAPHIKDDRAFVPVRFVSEALGRRVEWDGMQKKVTIW